MNVDANKGACARCGTMNFYENQRCSECGALLPWARTVGAPIEDNPQCLQFVDTSCGVSGLAYLNEHFTSQSERGWNMCARWYCCRAIHAVYLDAFRDATLTKQKIHFLAPVKTLEQLNGYHEKFDIENLALETARKIAS